MNAARAVVVCLLCPGAAALGQLVIQPPEHAPRPEDRIAVVSPVGANLPFKSLVERDAAGKVIPLGEPIEWAALRNNPLITPGDLARIEPELAARRRILDRIVIENLDLAEQIDEGLFEKINLGGNKAFTKLIDTSKPFRPTDLLPMSRALVKKGLLSPDQESLNNKITQEYKLATLTRTPPGGNPQQKAEAARRSLALMYKQGMDEPLFELRRMRLAAARSFPKAVPSMDLDRATALAVTEIGGRLRPEDDEKATLDLISQINARLTLEQRKQLLQLGQKQP
jgi:hypothetical protein